MRWFLLALIACTGCDVIFGLQRKPSDDVPDGGDRGDAGDRGDGGDGACGAPVLEDSFDDGAPACGTWGGPSEIGATIAETGGALLISLSAGMDEVFGGCTHTSLTPFTAGGIELEVPQVVSATGPYVVFHAYAADPSTQVDAWILYQATQLMVFAGTERSPRVQRTYDATTMRWWRLRPAPDNKSVLAEYSPDGTTYALLGAVAGTPPSMVKLNFGAGGAALPAGTQAAISHVRVCGP